MALSTQRPKYPASTPSGTATATRYRDRRNRHEQACAQTEDHAAQNIATEHVGPERVREGGGAKHLHDLHGLGIVRRDDRRGESGERQNGKNGSAADDETRRPPQRGTRTLACDRIHGQPRHSAIPSAMRGSSQPTMRSVTSETMMKMVAMASTPTCTVG